MRAVVLFSFLLLHGVAEAQYFQADFMKRKQDGKESSRWTVSDWVGQKRRMGLMDLWLAGNNTQNLFEFDFGGGTQSMKVKTKSGSVSMQEDKDSTRYYLSFFVSMVGLQGNYLESDEGYKQYSANINLRLLGASQQGTRFNVKYGFRQRDKDMGPGIADETWGQQFAGAELNLYLTHFLGIEGDYNYYFKDTSKQGTELSGDEVKAGVFLEYAFVRLFANYKHENEKNRAGGVDTTIRREGFEYGARMYF